MHGNSCLSVAFCLLLSVFILGTTMPAMEDVATRARQARDRGDVDGLEALLKSAHEEASRTGIPDANVRVAIFADWLVEAAKTARTKNWSNERPRKEWRLRKKAVKLIPDSSEAHRLLGELLGELIPHVFAGGIRYGERSTREIEKAIQLDPRNPNAYIARATSYFFTPKTFGGSKEKAVDMLKKAIAAEPNSDAAQTAHVWLAVVYQSLRQKEMQHRKLSKPLN